MSCNKNTVTLFTAFSVDQQPVLIPNQKRRGKSETCFDFAVIGCEKHVEIGQKLPKYAAEP